MAVQRVRRVIRKIDPWTVFKVSVVFNAILALAFVLGTIIFWSIFVNAGIPQRINDMAQLVGLEEGINLDGVVYFRIVALLAVIGTVLLTGFMVLAAVVYNLITDLVGGIEFITLEETVGAEAPRSVSLPVVARETKPRRKILPDIKPVSRTEPPGDGKTVEEPAPATTAEARRTGS